MKTEKQKDLEVIRGLMLKHNLEIVTHHSAYIDDDLISDPIIWTIEDLEVAEISKDQWFEGRAFKTLKERSIEEGWQIMKDCML